MSDIEDLYGDLTGYVTNGGRSVINGDWITFNVYIDDADDILQDPTELYFRIFRSQMRPATARLRYVVDPDGEDQVLDLDDESGDEEIYDLGDEEDEGEVLFDGGEPYETAFYELEYAEITRVARGMYKIDIFIPLHLVPGQYIVQWEFKAEGDTFSYIRETFFIVDPPIVEIDQYDPPRIAGKIIEAKLYNDMGLGNTDAILLIGHADGLTLNDPYHVADMQEAINILQADLDSPLLRACLEAYNAGCRDIHLVAAAPMREYVDTLSTRAEPNPEWGGSNYYERYADRLEETYRIMVDYDMADIIVPIEAPFYDALGVDFFTPLVKLVADVFATTSKPPLAVIGSRYDSITAEQIQEVATDPRLAALQEDEYLSAGGKMVLIAFGEALIRMPFLPNPKAGSAAVAAASYLATSSLKRGLSHTKLPNVSTIAGLQFSKEQVTTLSNARINPLIYTAQGRRGAPYNVVLATDNTQARIGSQYWSVVQMRIVARVIRDIRALGYQVIGSVDYIAFKERVKRYFVELQRENLLKNYTFNIERDAADPYKLIVDIILWPKLGLNDIRFSVRTGPLDTRATTSQYILGEDYVFNPDTVQQITEGEPV